MQWHISDYMFWVVIYGTGQINCKGIKGIIPQIYEKTSIILMSYITGVDRADKYEVNR
jgi:hypothetical protein